MVKIDTNINLIYTHHTPHGFIQNGYKSEVLKEIFIKSLLENDNNIHKSPFISYWKFLVDNNKKYKIKRVNKSEIYKTPSLNNFVNIYPIEDLKNKKFSIGSEVFKEMNNVKNFLFLIIDYDDSISDEFIDEIIKFKKQNKINRNKFIYISSNYKTNITQCSQLVSDFDFLKEDLFKKIITKYKKINKVQII